MVVDVMLFYILKTTKLRKDRSDRHSTKISWRPTMCQALCDLAGFINTEVQFCHSEHLSVGGTELAETFFLLMMERTHWWASCFTQHSCLSLFLHPIAYRTEATLGVSVSDSSINCIEQTTEWSACSKSCGMGFSTRVTNRNPQCEMVKQTRLCMVRPCEQEQKQPAEKVGAWNKPPTTEEEAWSGWGLSFRKSLWY